MRIVAFDLSLTCTGWCDGAGVGTLVPPKGSDRGVERLNWIAQQVMAKADDAQLVAIEGYAFARVNQAHQLGELGGIIRWHLWAGRVPYVVIPPACRAMFAAGKGNARKEEVLAAAIRTLKYSGHSNDEADAMWLWQMAAWRYSEADGARAIPHTDARVRALSKIEWPSLNQETA